MDEQKDREDFSRLKIILKKLKQANKYVELIASDDPSSFKLDTTHGVAANLMPIIDWEIVCMDLNIITIKQNLIKNTLDNLLESGFISKDEYGLKSNHMHEVMDCSNVRKKILLSRKKGLESVIKEINK